MTQTQNPFDTITSRLEAIESKLLEIAQRETPKAEARYYPVAKAAEKLNVAPITIYRGIESGRIPHKKIGSRVLVPSSFIDK